MAESRPGEEKLQIEYVPVSPETLGLDPLVLPDPMLDDENDASSRDSVESSCTYRRCLRTPKEHRCQTPRHRHEAAVWLRADCRRKREAPTERTLKGFSGFRPPTG
ncbi:MAG: hypothetical protein K1X67_14155 [Fimbriimonadaceae bacterium]|nr:hypothetical protein [Fimbriimonadaceae bacterium]